MQHWKGKYEKEIKFDKMFNWILYADELTLILENEDDISKPVYLR